MGAVASFIFGGTSQAAAAASAVSATSAYFAAAATTTTNDGGGGNGRGGVNGVNDGGGGGGSGIYVDRTRLMDAMQAHQSVLLPSDDFHAWFAWLRDWLQMIPGFGFAVMLLNGLLYYMLIMPLETLYFRGPTIGGFGFWNGALAPDICHALNPNLPSFTWIMTPENTQVCQNLINRKFDNFLRMTMICLYTVMVISFLRRACFPSTRRKTSSSSSSPSTPIAIDGGHRSIVHHHVLRTTTTRSEEDEEEEDAAAENADVGLIMESPTRRRQRASRRKRSPPFLRSASGASCGGGGLGTAGTAA